MEAPSGYRAMLGETQTSLPGVTFLGGAVDKAVIALIEVLRTGVG